MLSHRKRIEPNPVRYTRGMKTRRKIANTSTTVTVCFSPIRMGVVSDPTMRSPCTSMSSIRADRMNTRTAMKIRAAIISPSKSLPAPRAGRMVVTAAHPAATDRVFDPGMSFNRPIFSPFLPYDGEHPDAVKNSQEGDEQEK